MRKNGSSLYIFMYKPQSPLSNQKQKWQKVKVESSESSGIEIYNVRYNRMKPKRGN